MCVGHHPVHFLARTKRSPSAPRRAVIKSNVMAISAVLCVSTSGVLVTINSFAFAAGISMWLYPTPKFAKILQRLSSTFKTSVGNESQTVGHTASYCCNAALNSSAVNGRSVSLSVTSYKLRSFSSTDAGQRRVINTLGLFMFYSKKFRGYLFLK